MRTLNYQKFKKFISVILLVSIMVTSNGFVTFSKSINPEQDTVNNDIESPFLVQKTKTAGSYYKQFKENFNNKTDLLYNNVEDIKANANEEILDLSDPVLDDEQSEIKIKPKTSHESFDINEEYEEESEEIEDVEEELDLLDTEDEESDVGANENSDVEANADNVGANVHGARPEDEENSTEANADNVGANENSGVEANENSGVGANASGARPEDEENSTEANADNVGANENSGVEANASGARPDIEESQTESTVSEEIKNNISSSSIIDEEVVKSDIETVIETPSELIASISTIEEVYEAIASSSVIKNKNLQKIYYGVGEEEEEAHVHKICGISSESICRHTLVAPHDDYIQYKATISSLDDLESMTGGSYFLDRDLEYITAIGSVTYLELIPEDDIYICLNGCMLKNVVFLASNYTVTITNCKPTVATWINKDTTHSCKSNLDLFGIGDNLVFETSLLYKSTGDAKTINAYSTTFKNYYNDIDVTSEAYVNAVGLATFETCTMSEAMRAKNMILANSDLVTLNCLFDNNSTADALITKTGSGTWQMLGHNTFTNNTWGTSVASSLIYVNGGAVVLPEDTTAIFNGNINTNISSSLFKVNAGKLDVKERAVLDISYNDMCKHSDSWSSFLRVIGTNCQFYNYGEIHVRNNRVTNCISSYNSNNISGINTATTIHISENSIIQIEGNRAVDNNGRDANYNTYKTFYFYDIYGGANPLFTRDTEYIFDKTSIIAEIGMYTNGTAAGTIMQNYTAETIKDFDYFSYLTDFDICTFDNRANACPYLDLSTNEMKIIINSHQHKVCGQDKNTTCTHTKVSAHTVYKPYNDYNHVKDVTEMSKGWWYLSANLSSTSLKVITMETDVWLCLNGKTLTNYVFRNAEGKNYKLYVSSCSASGTMANTTNEYMLTGDEEIYGMDIVTTSKTATYFVNLKSNYIYKNKNTTDRTVFYICNFVNYNQTVTGNTLVDLDGNNNVVFEIIRSDSANGGNKIISLKNVRLTFYGLSFIKVSRITDSYLYLDNSKITFNGLLSFNQCTYSESADLNGLIKLVNSSTFTSASISIKVRTVVSGQVVTTTETLNVSYSFTSNTGYYIGSMLSVSNNSSFTLDTATSFVCESNKIDRSKNRNGVNALLYLENNTISLKGSISIKNNQITACNQSAAADTGVCSAVYMAASGVLNIGSGAITINNNTTNGNQTTNPSYHMYQVFSENANGFIAQSASTKLDINNCDIVVFARNYQNAIIYRNYTNANVNNYSPTSFISHVVADSFNPTDLDVIRDVNSNLVLHTGLHRHKLCGVAEGTACTHTEIAAHTSAIAYTEIPAISSTYTLQDFVNTIKGGGVYCLTDNVENNTSSIMQIQIDYPVYI